MTFVTKPFILANTLIKYKFSFVDYISLVIYFCVGKFIKVYFVGFCWILLYIFSTRMDLLEKLAEEAAAEKLPVTVRRLDVTVKEDIENLAGDITSIDILFNCAGYARRGCR